MILWSILVISLGCKYILFMSFIYFGVSPRHNNLCCESWYQNFRKEKFSCIIKSSQTVQLTIFIIENRRLSKMAFLYFLCQWKCQTIFTVNLVEHMSATHNMIGMVSRVNVAVFRTVRITRLYGRSRDARSLFWPTNVLSKFKLKDAWTVGEPCQIVPSVARLPDSLSRDGGGGLWLGPADC